MFKKTLLIFLITFLMCIFWNNSIYASEFDNIEQNIDNLENYLTLKNEKSQKILKGVPEKLVENWYDIVLDGNWTKEIDALLIVKLLANKQYIKFLTIDYPLNLSYEIVKEVIGLAKLLGTNDISGLIGKIEKVTVGKSIEYVMDTILKNEIKIGSGAIVMNYIAKDRKNSEAQINYLISEKYIDDKKSEIVVKFYSPKKIKVPGNPGPLGGYAVVFEEENEIKPFIVTLKGQMKYTNFNYFWIGTPEITVEYPEVVPDFGFKPTSFWEEKIMKPIKNSLKDFKKLFSFFGASVFDAFKVKDLEKIEGNEELKKLSEDIKEIEDEIDDEIQRIEGNDQTDEEFAQRVAQLNLENQSTNSNNEEEPSDSENDMSEEELRTLLIKIYNELVKRKLVLSDLANESEEKKKEEPKKEEKKEKEKKEEKKKEEKEIVSYCNYQGQTPSRNDLIINEVAWMGTDKNAADEWIELKNIGNKVLDLKGYQLLDKDNQIKIIFEELKINPGEHALLERTDDNTVPNIKADVIYKGNLNNNNESLYLFNSACLLEDVVEANPNWPAGDSLNRKSMERKSDLGWQTYSGDSYGTPKTKNSEGKVIVLPGGGGGGSSSPKYCAQTDLNEALKSPVIINEVSWMGTSNSSSDEWIELKNITDQDVSLKEYQLLDKDNQIKVIFGNEDLIPANGFYLLERTNDDTVPGIKADKIYAGALSDTNESLRLFNQNCKLVDGVLSNPNWPAGDSLNKKSMERKSDLSWRTYSGDSFGTPKAQNSEEESLSPSSVFCKENGGDIITRMGFNGDYNVCVFSSGNECEEEAMYSELCPLGGIDVSSYTEEAKYCAIKGGQVVENTCVLQDSKVCNLTDYYNGSCADNMYGKGLIITDIDDGYQNDEREYVRIFNQSEEVIELCSSTECKYLAYFSRDGNGNLPKWNEPNLNITLPQVTLNANSHFQIDFNKNNRGDFKVPLPDLENDGYFYPNNASVCLFDKDVTLLTEEEAKKAKIDCAGWLFPKFETDPNNIKEGSEVVRSGEPYINDDREKMISRKIDSNLYIDRDNNSIDFEHKKPLIYTVPAVLNFDFTELEDKTKLKLSWDFDESLDMEKISYKIYYTKNSAFDEDNLTEITQENTISNGKHVETTVYPIEEGIDYRFIVKIFEQGGNESIIKDPLFYTYSSSFNDHMYGLLRYDSNKTNKTDYIGPQKEVVMRDLIIGESDTSFTITPLIDKYGNLYIIHPLNIPSFNTSIASYDKNGLFRWKFNMFDYYGQGELILADSIYYLTGDGLIKFSLTGEKLWQNHFDALQHNFLYNNNNLYFKCNTLDKIGMCKTSIQENVEVELIYTMLEDKQISNLLIDDFSNIFFIYDLKLIKVAPDKSFEELSLEGIDDGTRINILRNKILISSYSKEILVDKDSMIKLLDEARDPLHSVAVASDGFYIFEVVGYDDALIFLDINDNSMKHLSFVKRTNMNGYPCVVDINNNIYYMSSENNLVGYKRGGNTITQLFDQNTAKDSMGFDIILINGKIYYPAWDKLVEASFE